MGGVAQTFYSYVFGFHRWYFYTVFLNVPRDAQQCFTLIHNSVKDTIAEPYFLSILQHLLCIRDDMYSRSVQAKLFRSFYYHVFTITIFRKIFFIVLTAEYISLFQAAVLQINWGMCYSDSFTQKWCWSRFSTYETFRNWCWTSFK